MIGLTVTHGGKIGDSCDDIDETDTMMIHGCGFMITEKRYKEIVSEMVKKTLNY